LQFWSALEAPYNTPVAVVMTTVHPPQETCGSIRRLISQSRVHSQTIKQSSLQGVTISQ